MTPFQERLARRAATQGVRLSELELSLLSAYFDLLVRWNPRINLTALPLEGPPEETVDRLFLEPLVAANFFPSDATLWFDVGSGGGSPAVPLKVLKPGASLTMVESRGRKAAFLREVVRHLGLEEAIVAERRFEAVASTAATSNADVITVRAVRIDEPLFELCRRALRIGGKLLLFQSSPVGSVHFPARLSLRTEVQLTDKPSFLTIFEAV